MVKRSQTVVKERKIWKYDIHFFFFACHPGPNTNLICLKIKLEWPNGYIMVEWINNCKSAKILNFTSFLLRLFQSLHGSSLFAHTESHSSAEEKILISNTNAEVDTNYIWRQPAQALRIFSSTPGTFSSRWFPPNLKSRSYSPPLVIPASRPSRKCLFNFTFSYR